MIAWKSALTAGAVLTVVGIAAFGVLMILFPKHRKAIFAAEIISPIPPVP